MKQPPTWARSAVLAICWLVATIAFSIVVGTAAPYRVGFYLRPGIPAFVVAARLIHRSWKVPVLLCVFDAISLVVFIMIGLLTWRT
jgi:hypothetical protein